jgi:AAA+ ATPase superfamily predicted ATPase
MLKIENPFLISGYVSAEYFCDREEETKELISRVKNNIPTTLTSIRRIGKTGLIKHLNSQLSNDTIAIYIDLLPTESVSGFNNTLLTAIASAVNETNNTGKKIWRFIKQLRPVISYDVYTGIPQIAINADTQQAKGDLHASLMMLESLDKKIVIAIDEFQQILNYPEKNFDSWLRTIIQEMINTVFIFSGSRQHMMNEMFANTQRPFYRSTQFLKLEKIEHDVYKNFIISTFSKYKKNISGDITNTILEWTDRHTYYTQVLSNRVFAATNKKTTEDILKNEMWKILKEQESVFYRYRDLLSTQQWTLLKAMAKQDIVYSVTTGDFLRTNKLNSSATAIKTLRTLINKEMVYEEYDKNGKRYYSVYDLFFKRWIQELR